MAHEKPMVMYICVKIAYLLLVSFFLVQHFIILFAFFHPQFLAKSYGIVCASI